MERLRAIRIGEKGYAGVGRGAALLRIGRA